LPLFAKNLINRAPQGLKDFWSPRIPFVLYMLRNVSQYCKPPLEVFAHLSQEVVAA
jgi:hypothetical protein